MEIRTIEHFVAQQGCDPCPSESRHVGVSCGLHPSPPILTTCNHSFIARDWEP